MKSRHKPCGYLPVAALFSVRVDQDAVGGLTLAAVAGNGVAIVQMRVFSHINSIHLPESVRTVISLSLLESYNGSKLAVGNVQIFGRSGELDTVTLRRNSRSASR